ncbi:MAG: BON domain-containing protein [Chitinophagaceae bacterium]|nr:MAG: BON domain-containing protein [Chitinophagaceae bacterium]
MKQLFLSLAVAGTLLSGGLASCKGKDKQKVETQTTYPGQETTTNPPVTISADDSLRQRLPAVTKDYPTVQTTVSNGEVTLTGTVERERLPRLMQAVQAMNPRKVNNQLTIK